MNRATTWALMAALMLGAAPAMAVSNEDLLKRLEKLEQEVAVQKDIEAVRRLQYAYNYYNSSSMHAQAMALISDKAESIEIGGRGVYHGKKGFIEAFAAYADDSGQPRDRPQAFGNALFQIAAMDVITIAADGRSAQARLRVLTPIFRNYPQTTYRLNAGEYEMGYVKEEGVWKISRFKYVHTFSAQFNRDGTITPLYSTAPDKSADAPTTWYHPWPETGTLQFHFPNPVTGELPPQLLGPTHYWIGNWPGEFGKTGHH